jgi:hypothetical protein
VARPVDLPYKIALGVDRCPTAGVSGSWRLRLAEDLPSAVRFRLWTSPKSIIGAAANGFHPRMSCLGVKTIAGVSVMWSRMRCAA